MSLPESVQLVVIATIDPGPDANASVKAFYRTAPKITADYVWMPKVEMTILKRHSFYDLVYVPNLDLFYAVDFWDETVAYEVI